MAGGGQELHGAAEAEHLVTGVRGQDHDPAAGSPLRRAQVVETAPRLPAVLSGARIITMKGDEMYEKGDIAITDNRIVAVGPAGKVTIPAGAKRVDMTGKTIIPGFVDVHAHMWPPRDLHQSQVWQYLANLAYGVTTTRDPLV